MRAVERDGLPIRQRRMAMLAILLGTTFCSVDSSIMNVALPTLAHDLQVPDSSAVLVVSVHQLIQLMMLLPFAALSERLGMRPMFNAGLACGVVGAIACSLATSLPLLVAARILQALGAAAIMSVSSAIIRGIFPHSMFGRAISLNTMVIALVAMVAPTLGGIILTVAHWPWLFLMLLPFGIASYLAGRGNLPNPVRHGEAFDIRGAMMCAGIIAIAFTGIESGVHGAPIAVAAALILIAVVLGTLFVRRETRQARPIFPVDLLRSPTINRAAISTFAVFVATMTISLLIPFRAQQELHFSPALAGAVMAPWPIAMLIVTPIAGAMSDRTSAALTGAVGMAIAIVGAILIVTMPTMPGAIDIGWRVGFIAIGFSLFFPSSSRQIVGSAPMDRAAAAGGLVSTIVGAGRTLGATLVAGLIANGFGLHPHAQLFTAGFCVVAFLGCFSLVRRQARGAKA